MKREEWEALGYKVTGNVLVKASPIYEGTAVAIQPMPTEKRSGFQSPWSPKFYLVLMRHMMRVPQPEYKFHPTRKWRFDYAWPEYKLALEVDGGIWTQGRHTRGSGRLGDMEKFNHAAMLGWRILYVTPQQLCTAQTADMIRKAMGI